MSRGVNKVILIGNLGSDPEIRYMPNGNAVANVTVATSESWKDQQGQQQERTEWHRVVMYKRLAEITGEYLKKGSKVYLEGRNRTREYTDNQGIKRWVTEVIVSEMQMLDSVKGKPQSAAPAQPAAAPQYPDPGSIPPMDFDDDIPFAPLGLQYPQLHLCC